MRRLLFALLVLVFAPNAWAQAAGARCRVLDTELARSYSGGCKDGLAEGEGEARGLAEYRGGFKAGHKHGKGVKTWPNGDRYEGDFVEDRKEGQGSYSWGPRSEWPGERYTGGFRNDMRNGFGTYEWPTGDRYVGPWEDDRITGPPTSMMIARSRAEKEITEAVSKPGIRVCRRMEVGLALHEWIRGTVMQVADKKVAVRIDEPGDYGHIIAGVPIRARDVVWDSPLPWTPCF